MRDGAWVSVFLATVGVVVFVVVYSVTWITVGYDRRNCQRWSEATGREVQFRQWSHWSWECFAQTGDGKWLPKDQLRDVVPS